MNERIDKLLVAAGAYFGGEGVVYDTFDPKKFAELIVKECMSLVSEPGPDMNDTERGILAQIKDHFGVKE